VAAIPVHRVYPFVPERSRSSIHSRRRSLSSPMRHVERRAAREPNRLSNCSSCGRPFAICGSCDRGRRHFSPQCARTRRQGQLQRAGRRCQASERGRAAHALRQARYRARRAGVTHPPCTRAPSPGACAAFGYRSDRERPRLESRSSRRPGRVRRQRARGAAGRPASCETVSNVDGATGSRACADASSQRQLGSRLRERLPQRA
jgi:hypothetical protein